MPSLHDIPELIALETRRQIVRIPPETDVPLTRRVKRVLDAPEFRRLAHISQLGLVGLVYPAANHTRLEHSLGVYRLALLYLKQLSYNERFTELVRPADAELFLAAALVHDLGHWPFCHPLEDLHLTDVPRHEKFANGFLLEGEIADALRDDWNLAPEAVAALLSEKPRDARSRLLASMLSGPIDIDKMDYLPRDSLHAGVPYGRNFDQQRLIGSLCVNAGSDGLALTDKGRTAAEMMVFARYVMFSEVYWHHAVRSATAMLQRAFYLMHGELDLENLFRLTEAPFIIEFQRAADGTPAGELLAGLFGLKRRLYKRLGQFSYFQGPDLYKQLARKPYPWLANLAENFARVAGRALGAKVAPHEVLFDAPPVKREIEFRIDIFFPKEETYRSLGDVSPVVESLAHKQFDDFVKRVRLFVHPRLADDLRRLDRTEQLVAEALGETNADSSE